MKDSARTLAISLLGSALLVAVGVPSARAADATVGDCLSASESSLKLRKDHHFRDARQQLLVCAALTCPGEVRSECERRLVAVNAAIPTLVLEARDAAGNDLSAVTITMDGKLLADRLEGTALSLDPGAHSFRFETAGAAPVDLSLVLREGEKDRRERIVFGAPSAGGQASKGGGGSARTSAAPSPGSRPGMSTVRVLGIASGGVGLVGLALGGVFTAMASSAANSQQSACSPASCPNRTQALSDRASFLTDNTLEIVGFVAGGALLATGVALFVAGRSKAEPEAAKTGLVLFPAISPGGAALTLHGDF